MKNVCVFCIVLLASITSAQVWQCTIANYSGSTKQGDNLGRINAGSGPECGDSCCQNSSCYSAAYVASENGCYMKTKDQTNSQATTPDASVILYVLTNKTFCSTCSPPPNFPCKRGLAYDYQSATDVTALKQGVKWYYNWSPQPNASISPFALGVEFVPMIWGKQFDVQTVISQIPSSSKYLLGFNEPNFWAQSNISAMEAASLWPKVEQVADAKGLKIVSPAVNYCGPANQCQDTDPFSYLDDFFGNCTGCRVDYVAAHWYACNEGGILSYLASLKKYGKPIWLTEFSCGDATPALTSYSQQDDYMQIALNVVENDVDVFRYAWFSGRAANVDYASLLNAAAGSLSVLGDTYNTYPQYCPAGTLVPSMTSGTGVLWNSVGISWLIGLSLAALLIVL